MKPELKDLSRGDIYLGLIVALAVSVTSALTLQ